MDWSEQLAFNASAPSAEGLAAMAAAVSGAGARVVEVRRLTGGLDAATHAVRLDPGGWRVLKRVPPSSRGAIESEFERLRFVARAPVATPAPVALDAGGGWFGHPALLMTMLDGSSKLPSGTSDQRWIASLARALAAIHSTALDGHIPDVLRAPHAAIGWEPPAPDELPRSPDVDLLVAAGAEIGRGPRRAPDVLLHHDFHRGNVLWRDGEVGAVLDWNEARLGPAVCDVAYCSVDVTMTHGLAAGRSFVAAYEVAAGPVDDLARWQCLWTANALRWVDVWIDSFIDAGEDLTVEEARQRLMALAGHLAGKV